MTYERKWLMAQCGVRSRRQGTKHFIFVFTFVARLIDPKEYEPAYRMFEGEIMPRSNRMVLGRLRRCGDTLLACFAAGSREPAKSQRSYRGTAGCGRQPLGRRTELSKTRLNLITFIQLRRKSTICRQGLTPSAFPSSATACWVFTRRSKASHARLDRTVEAHRPCSPIPRRVIVISSIWRDAVGLIGRDTQRRAISRSLGGSGGTPERLSQRHLRPDERATRTKRERMARGRQCRHRGDPQRRRAS